MDITSILIAHVNTIHGKPLIPVEQVKYIDSKSADLLWICYNIKTVYIFVCRSPPC